MNHPGLRHNENKLPWELLPIKATEELLKVLQKGAIKYAPRNWEKGLSWSDTAASAYRHLAAFMSGEDYDKEDGLLHVAHLMANATFLAQFYHTYPQGDDRPICATVVPKFTLDVDDVLADFVGGLINRGYIDEPPTTWAFSYEFIHKILPELELDQDFWLSLESLQRELPFEPEAYISSRSIPVEWTQMWLEQNGYPARPVYHSKSKVDIISRIDPAFHVDDSLQIYKKCREAGIACYLYTARHNLMSSVGHWRILTLEDIPMLKSMYPVAEIEDADDHTDIV